MRKLILVAAAIAAVAGGGMALASHVQEVDPATVPPGFLAAHNRVSDVPVSAFARAAAADGAEVTVQHIRLVANQRIPWHTHPGPVFVLVERGAFTYEYAQGTRCIRTTYEAGSGFVDPGFGEVHQAAAGPAGAEIYAVTCSRPAARINSSRRLRTRTAPPEVTQARSRRNSRVAGSVGSSRGRRTGSDTYSEMATIASMMTGTSSGEGPCPGAERACRPASPQISMIRSLKPFTTFALSWNSGALWT